MKVLVIGDIHGCLTQLKELIKGVDRSTTRIICCGDLIDRGPDSRGVINFIRDNNIESVRGNHEDMLLECEPYIQRLVDGEEYTKSFEYEMQSSDWFYNGGRSVLLSYNGNYTSLLEDIKFIKALPLFIETGIKDNEGLELLVSHAWCSYKDLSEITNPFDFVWDRRQPATSENESKYYNVFGHTPVDYVNQYKYHKGPEVTPEPEWSDGTANIDLGAAYSSRGRGHLCGLFFPSLKYKTVKSSTLETYYSS